ncbi:MAG: MarR family transcriptional regulator [Xenococcaceae cyanobacterium MO_188.B32]|nr:MarR family transcriptional regulator [Xenococcaceae cyanobacterium MO_188.B32]
MSSTKIQGKFYPLQHQELLHLNQILTQSELSVYLWLKTNDPFGQKLIEADTQEIAKDLRISRRTVQRALVKLRAENLIDLVINKFKYQMKSKSTFENDDSAKIGEQSEVATSTSPDDIEIVSATGGSSQRQEDRLNDTHVAKVSPMSPSSPEIKSEQGFQNSKINKTYIDFKDSLSESERENFLRFVEKKIENLEKPINDLEAWLASKTKAKQNRWEVYYQTYQQEEKQKVTESFQNFDSQALKEKEVAIKNWQKHLKQQRLENQLAKKERKPNLESQPKSKAIIDLSEENSDPWAETPSSDLSQINSSEVSPLQKSESDLKQKINQIFNDFSRVEPDGIEIPSQPPTQDLSQEVERGLQYLKDIEPTKCKSETKERELEGEKS